MKDLQTIKAMNKRKQSEPVKEDTILGKKCIVVMPDRVYEAVVTQITGNRVDIKLIGYDFILTVYLTLALDRFKSFSPDVPVFYTC